MELPSSYNSQERLILNTTPENNIVIITEKKPLKITCETNLPIGQTSNLTLAVPNSIPKDEYEVFEDKEKITLIIQNPKKHHSGKYTCTWSKDGEVKLTRTFRVIEGLNINTAFDDYKVLHEGRELELACKNNVDNSQNVTWIPPNVPRDAYTLDKKVGNEILNIKNATRSDAGFYICMSSDTNGNQLTKGVHVGVPPIIKILVNGVESTGEKNVFFWDKCELECIDDDHTYPKSIPKWNPIYNLEDKSTTNKMYVHKSGTYTCTSYNEIGSSESTVNINIIPSEFAIVLGVLFAFILGMVLFVRKNPIKKCKNNRNAQIYSAGLSGMIIWIVILIIQCLFFSEDLFWRFIIQAIFIGIIYVVLAVYLYIQSKISGFYQITV